MGRVVLSFSMSLDGFAAGPDVSDVNPMGVSGERLHDWMFNKNGDRSADEQVLQESLNAVGAVVVGRRTFDLGLRFWNDTPYPAPTFVLTHEKRDPLAMKSASFTFVNDGIHSAVHHAKVAAGGKEVIVMGASAAQQVLEAGLADVLRLQIVPVLLGAGVRLFDNIGAGIELERTRVIESPSVTHIDFRVSH